MNPVEGQPPVRPLHCEAPGIWKSQDGYWTFMRHESDPHPKRWFTYEEDDREPTWFEGHLSLRDAVANAEHNGRTPVQT